MDAKYAEPDGRKVVYSSVNPIKLLKNANVFTFVAIVLVNGVIVGVVFAVRGIVKHRRKKRAKRESRRYERKRLREQKRRLKHPKKK